MLTFLLLTSYFVLATSFHLSPVTQTNHVAQLLLNPNIGTQRRIRRSNSQLKLLAIKVALTRERNANDKLKETFQRDPASLIECVEIPCIQFHWMPELDLSEHISNHDVVVLTSPQAALVFLKHWRTSSKKKVRIASVGHGTSKPLIAEGLTPIFEPSEATGECLAKELPFIGETVFYPCSAIASNQIETILASRGFKVTRANSYYTAPCDWTEEEYKHAEEADIVAFASPSAVKVWKDRMGTHQQVVAIGPTTEKAALRAGFTRVSSPNEGSQGIDHWAAEIKNVAVSIVNTK